MFEECSKVLDLASLLLYAQWRKLGLNWRKLCLNWRKLCLNWRKLCLNWRKLCLSYIIAMHFMIGKLNEHTKLPLVFCQVNPQNGHKSTVISFVRFHNHIPLLTLVRRCQILSLKIHLGQADVKPCNLSWSLKFLYQCSTGSFQLLRTNLLPGSLVFKDIFCLKNIIL